MSAPLEFQSIPELGRRLREDGLSPVALAVHCLERLERLGPRLNAVVTLTRDRALAEAKAAESDLRAGRDRGPLHGIPYGAKDLLATGGGIPTSWGFEPLRGQTFDRDAAVIERLGAAGAVLCAKLAMVELAGGMNYDRPAAAFTGPGINPWNEGAWTGGSSSGSGSAVAAGLVPFAIGSETNGSITSPSALCGISGVRPSFGRVSRRGAMALSWSLDKLGPMTRSAGDCGLVLEAIAGHDPEDPTTSAEPFHFRPADPPPAGWRVAVLEDALDTDQPAVRENVLAALAALEDVVQTEPTALPDLPFAETTFTVLFAEAGAALAHLWRQGLADQLRAPESRAVPYATQTIPAVDYLDAMRLRARWEVELGGWLAQYDAVATPTLKKVAPPTDQRLSEYFGAYRRLPVTALGNLLGWPAVSVPCGFGERGLPTAIQFIGKPGSENVLLGMAAAYQSRTDWHLRQPELR